MSTLVHLRNVYDFLTSGTGIAKRVVAQNYAPMWKRPARDVMSRHDEEEMNGRVCHIGVVRSTVTEEGAFDWTAFLNRVVPLVLATFRDFLHELPAELREQFFQPTSAHQRTDLVAVINTMIG